VNGKQYSQPLTIRMDPRVKASASAFSQQFARSNQVYQLLLQVTPALTGANSLRKQVEDLQKQAQSNGPLSEALGAFDQKLQALAGAMTRRPGAGNEPPSLGLMSTRLKVLLTVIEETDDAPTTQVSAAVNDLDGAVRLLLLQWRDEQ